MAAASLLGSNLPERTIWSGQYHVTRGARFRQQRHKPAVAVVGYRGRVRQHQPRRLAFANLGRTGDQLQWLVGVRWAKLEQACQSGPVHLYAYVVGGDGHADQQLGKNGTLASWCFKLLGNATGTLDKRAQD